MSIEIDSVRLRRREYLIQRLRDRTIRPEEAQELRMMLEEERNQAMDVNDVLALFAIAGLLLILAGLLLDNRR